MWKKITLMMLMGAAATVSGFAVAGDLKCDVPEFSEQNILEIVRRERFIQKELPPEIENATKEVRRKRCHYVYVEYPNDRAVGKNRVFVINQYGAIVDATSGRTDKTHMVCPSVDFNKEILAQRLIEQRLRYTDVPAAPTNYKTKLTNLRCMFIYYEIQIPEADGKYQTFTFDFYGDLYEFYKSE